jgi:hypothetical protein
MKKFRDLLTASIDEEITGSTVERLAKVKQIFESEMLWETGLLSEPAMQKRLQDWLQGLCSTVSVPFMNDEIIAWYEEQLGRKAENDNECFKWLEKYWPQCGRTLYEMLYK